MFLLGQGKADDLVGGGRLTINEARLIRNALLAQVQALTQFINDNALAMEDSGPERWTSEDNLQESVYELMVVTAYLARLGREIDDWDARRRGELPDDDDDDPATSPSGEQMS